MTAKGKTRSSRPVAAKTPAQAKGFQHPLLEQARRLAKEGQARQAAEVLVSLGGQVKPFEQAQLLTHAAHFLKQEDRERALALAEQATSAFPGLAAAWIVLSQLNEERRERKAALEAARRALECTGINPLQRVDLGRHLARMGEDRQALDAVRRGYEASGEAIGLAPYTLRVALQCADWALVDRLTARIGAAHAAGQTREVGETPRTHLLWCADEATNIAVIRAFSERHYPAREPMARAPWPREKPRRLRVGYLSYDFRDHATALLAMGMLRHHDHDRFEFHAYCTSYDDGSALRRDVLSRFERTRMLGKLGDEDAARRIAADKLDVLVDLNGLTEGTRHGILAWRPAPVQISYLGYPGSAGGRYVDYIIGDDYTVPKGAEALYPEHVIRIPPSYQINDYLARYLPPRPARRPAGLPEGAPVIGMFNNVNKVRAEVWTAWMQILRAVPTAVLWMLDAGELAREHLKVATAGAGVDPARLVFAPKMKQEAHLARLRFCDLMLDPWPYGGHTTTADALFAGVPVVTLEGTNFASRVSGGLLWAAGLVNLVLPDVESYVARAVAILRNPSEIASFRQHLLRNRGQLPVFDAPGRTLQLEAAYAEAHARALRGQPATHLELRLGRRRPAEAAPA